MKLKYFYFYYATEIIFKPGFESDQPLKFSTRLYFLTAYLFEKKAMK